MHRKPGDIGRCEQQEADREPEDPGQWSTGRRRLHPAAHQQRAGGDHQERPGLRADEERRHVGQPRKDEEPPVPAVARAHREADRARGQEQEQRLAVHRGREVDERRVQRHEPRGDHPSAATIKPVGDARERQHQQRPGYNRDDAAGELGVADDERDPGDRIGEERRKEQLLAGRCDADIADAGEEVLRDPRVLGAFCADRPGEDDRRGHAQNRTDQECDRDRGPFRPRPRAAAAFVVFQARSCQHALLRLTDIQEIEMMTIPAITTAIPSNRSVPRSSPKISHPSTAVSTKPSPTKG